MDYSKFLTKLLLSLSAFYLITMALAIVYLAFQGDTTLLGDPYYEDKILAPQRAFIPWALTMGTILIAVIVSALDWYHEHYDNKKK